MKAAETKTVATTAKKESPFFSKESEQGFFGSSATKEGFFSNGGRSTAVQAKLRVGKANDPYEQEADRVAEKVVQRWQAPEQASTGLQTKRGGAGPITPLVQSKCASCEQEEQVQEKELQEENAGGEELQRKPIFESNAEPPDGEGDIQRQCAHCAQEEQVQRSGAGDADTAGLERQLAAEKGGGNPIPASTRSSLEHSFGADFSGVRIHTGSAATAMSNTLGAQAFTHGNDIYFNEGKYDPSSSAGKGLLAHELTHTIQQGASGQQQEETPVQRSTRPAGDQVVQRGILDSVAGSLGAVWDATGGQLVDAAGQVIEMGEDFFWGMLERISPAAVAVIREIAQIGVVPYLKNVLRSAVNHIFDGLQNNAGLLGSLGPTFQKLLVQARTIILALSNGDCKPLFAALNQLKDALTELAGEAWSKITTFLAPVGEFFENLWTSFGAPFIDWLKKLAGDVWGKIQSLGKQIWDWTAPLRNALARAWEWVKGKLGLSFDETGEEGLIQWVQQKASEAWDIIKAELEPIIGPIRTLIDKVRAIIPLDAILNLRETVNGWLDKAMAMGSAMEADGVAQQKTQVSLRDEILPAVLVFIERLRGGLINCGSWVASNIGALGTSVTGFFDSIRNNALLSPLSFAIDWLQSGVDALVVWAQDTVQELFRAIGDGLVYLSKFVRPILDLLTKIFGVLGDLLGKLPDLLMGPVWWVLPDCIKEPIKKFFIEQILNRIPLFQQLQAAGDVWAKLENAALFALKQVFVDGNIIGAIWTFYRTMLEILNVPPQLVTGIITKGAKAMKDIINAPFQFLGNFLRTLKGGFDLFFSNIWTHLLSGLATWMTAQLKDSGVEVPKEFTFKEIFKFVCSLLGITLNKILEKVEKVMNKPGLKDKLRKWIDRGVKALDWLIDLFKDGPAGVWPKIQQHLSNLWDMIFNGVAGWIQTTIIKEAMAWVAKKLDPTGVMVVISTIIDVFNIIQGIANQLREVLQIIDSLLDNVTQIVKGILKESSEAMEKILGKAVPVALTLLAYILNLNGIGEEVKKVVKSIHAKVDEALDWLALQAKGLIESIKGLFGSDDDKKDDTGLEDFTYKKDQVVMDQAMHSLIVESKGGTLKVLMHSDEVELIVAAREAREEMIKKMNAEKNGKNKRDYELVIGLLNSVLTDVKDIPHTIAVKLNEIKAPGKSTEQIEKELSAIEVSKLEKTLKDIGRLSGADSLQELVNQKVPSKRWLPIPGGQTPSNYIRGLFYEGMYSNEWTLKKADIKKRDWTTPNIPKRITDAMKNKDAMEWASLKRDELIDFDADISSYNHTIVEYAVDHVTPVARMWNNTGNISNDKTREDHLLDDNNLRYITKRNNSRKGSGGDEFDKYVRIGFESSIAEGGSLEAKTVRGDAFLDESGNAI